MLFGNFDNNIRLIEKEYGVNILNRSNEIRITGDSASVSIAQNIILKLLEMIRRGEEVTTQTVSYFIENAKENAEESVDDIIGDTICMTAKGKPIKSKTSGQKKYVDSIRKNEVVFGIGPAGTGKTYLAIAMAVSFLRSKRVSRIVLTRPAVEAGEKLGYLPGDLQEKINPYLRPLYDALYEILGTETFQKYIENGVIEVAPLAYMRGRTLDDSFIILDEAQNTTPEQMKMFLTRFGIGSRVVVTGDITQIDLGRDKVSGLKQVVKILKDIDGIDFVYLSDKDVVRHRLVMEIIRAYERYSSLHSD
ncbi:MAG TPA: phosphate starvation-inducible protein PhoH [Clostridiaceae bacterium]|nr:phosphate starvation-inducible protein PhoH [Clostridiaceae bacterium]